MTLHLDFLHAAAGALVGMLVGLTGVGGGALMTPLLVLLFGVSPQTAVGTDLLFAAVTKIAGSAVHGTRETVDWRIVRRLASGSIPAALLTLGVLASFGRIGAHGQQVILLALAVLLALTAVVTLVRKRLAGFAHGLEPLDPPAMASAGTIALGAAIGIAVTISSVGAGAIGVTVLLMLYPRMRMARIVGSDIAHAVPLALIAGIGHWMIGDVDANLLINLLIGSLPGVVIGSLLSSRASDKLLQPLLAIVLALSSWQLFAKAAKSEAPPPPAPASVPAADQDGIR